jgi:hypothetical protein
MKKIKVKHNEPEDSFEFWDDCERIKKIFAEHDYDITLEQARQMWELYSEDYCASWLYLSAKDEDIFNDLTKYYVLETLVESDNSDKGDK